MSFTVSIIGRPNVGKSTLFNRLTGTKHAIVDDTPGVTRDCRQGKGRVADIEFEIFDTPGLEEAEKEALESRMMEQTAMAVSQSDVCMLVVDGRLGVTPVDGFFANWLRKKSDNIIVVVNKCEGSAGDVGYNEALGLGFDYVVPLSAEHGEGMGDLYEAFAPYRDKYQERYSDIEIDLEDRTCEKHIQIAIVGRPNTGKSTLMNRLLGDERVLTGPEAGITRDSIAIDWNFDGHNIRLIDTAGIRRKSNVVGKVEKLSVGDSLRSIQFAHVAILMIDATKAFEKQDLAVAEMVIREGRAIVIGLNKWDLVKNKSASLDELEYQIDKFLPQIKGVKFVTMSALKGDNVDSIIKASLESYKMWNIRIPTAKLNEWLKYAESRHLPPLARNKKRIRLKYATQGKKRPPTFMIFANKGEDLPHSYVRYLVNSLRDSFKIPGIPIRMLIRKGKNPYDAKKR